MYSIDLNTEYCRLIIPVNNLSIVIIRFVVTVVNIVSAILISSGVSQCSNVTQSENAPNATETVRLCSRVFTVGTWTDYGVFWGQCVVLSLFIAIIFSNFSMMLLRLTSGALETRLQRNLAIVGFVSSLLCACVEAYYHKSVDHQYIKILIEQLKSAGYYTNEEKVHDLHILPNWTCAMVLSALSAVCCAVDAVLTTKFTKDHLLEARASENGFY